MRSKLLIFTIIVAVMLSIFALPVMASPTKVVDITSPESDQIVYNKEFSICGLCIYDDTTIELEYWDKDDEKFRPLLTTEGDSSFKVGSNKIFGKSVELKYKGKNEIRITSYTKSTKDDPQVDDYTITLGEKKGNWFTDIGLSIMDWLKN